MATYTIAGSYILTDGEVEYDDFSDPIIVNTDSVGRVTICGLGCKAYQPTEAVQREIRAMLAVPEDDRCDDDIYDYLANEIADNYDLLADAQADAYNDAEHMRALRSSKNYI